MGRIRERYQTLSVQAKASLWFLICAFLQKGISFITTPIFTRIMSTEEYGRFGVFYSWLGIVSVFVTLNLCYGVYSQGLVKFSKDRPVFSSSMQGLVLTLTCAYTVIYLIFHDFFNTLFNLSTVQMLAMMILIWTSAAFNFWAEEQRVEFKYKAIIVFSLILAIVKPALGVVLVIHSDDKVTARILAIVAVEMTLGTVLFAMQMRRGRVFCNGHYWAYGLRFNIPLIPHYLSTTILSSADRIMIENITSSSDAGIYNLAYSIALIMTLFNSSLLQTLSPWIYQKIKAKKIRDIGRVAYSTLIFIAAVNLLLILFAPEIVRIFAPPEFASAIWAIPPVIMSVYFMFSYDLFAKFAFYYERTLFVMLASVLGAGLNVFLNLLAIPRFGFVAAGYTTLICYMVFAILHYLYMRKVCQDCCDGVMPYRTSVLLRITVAFLLLGFLFVLTYWLNFLRYGLIALLLFGGIAFRKKIAEEVRLLIDMKKAPQA